MYDDSDEIDYIKGQVLQKFPLLGVTMSALNTVADSNIGTAATDGHNIYYSPKFFSSLSDDEKTFIYAHEVMHVAFNHILRSKGRDQALWNTATDAVVNQILKSEGLPIFGNSIDMPEAVNKSAEEIYDKLLKEKEKEKQEQQQGPQQEEQNSGNSSRQQGNMPQQQDQQQKEGGKDGKEGENKQETAKREKTNRSNNKVLNRKNKIPVIPPVNKETCLSSRTSSKKKAARTAKREKTNRIGIISKTAKKSKPDMTAIKFGNKPLKKATAGSRTKCFFFSRNWAI